MNGSLYIKKFKIFTTSIFYLKFKENNKNDMTFCYCCFWPMSMAALMAQAAADARLAGWMEWCISSLEQKKGMMIF